MKASVLGCEPFALQKVLLKIPCQAGLAAAALPPEVKGSAACTEYTEKLYTLASEQHFFLRCG